MNIKKQSLYVTLGIIIISTIVIIMSVQSTFTYFETKQKIIEEIRYNSEITIAPLQKNVTHYIEAYSVNEYENLIYNEMGHKSIFAIVVQDYNMGKVLGTDSLTSGKIRDKNWNIIDFDPNNKEQIKQLEESYYIDKQNIITTLGNKLGIITIYSSDRFMNIELNNIIIETFIETILISILLIVLLFITIHLFILKPISNIVKAISYSDDDGIPIELIPAQGSIEIFTLSNTMNNMINTIRASSVVLKEQKEKLNKLNYELEDKVVNEVAKRMEQQKILIRQSKLASMGEMIGNIAHQWRQPLNSLNVNIENLEFDYEDGVIDKEFLEKFIIEQTKTLHFMSRTIDNFRNFYRIDKQKAEFSVKEAIEDSVNIQISELNKYNIKIDLTGEDFIIYGFENEFLQVIMNLISNAKDAIIESKQENGQIDILLINHLTNKVIVTDNGGGIPFDIIERIFEPYYTTKEQGKGTGMGLYMSKMIIEDNMGGKISVSSVDGGAKFIIELG
ncbi:MAG: HAMP domain-containing histidine kinase [Arcobacteraceae bacterium]|nr:HAMP domain-containing histidine kinase [Arcobacteraceae bacterium]